MLVIRAARAFDGERALPGPVSVFVADGRIVGLESGEAPVPDGWNLVEHPTATVLPGLFDLHSHLGGDSRDGALDRLPEYSPEQLDAVITDSLRRELAVGVTVVRDLGDRDWSVLHRRDRAADGLPAPTILAAGPPITSARGHCWRFGSEVVGPDRLRAAVRERAERGVNVVKVMGTGGTMTPGTDLMRCQFTLTELRLIVDEAHAAGLPVTVHAHNLPAVEQALAAGADGIEHCTCLTDRGVWISDDLLHRLAARQVAVCPTLGTDPDALPPPSVRELLERLGLTREVRLALVARAHRAGVRIVSGADSGISAAKPHGSLPAAVADLVAGGIPAAEALASATSLAADTVGLGGRKGRLRAGHDADLLLCAGDPLDRIEALTAVTAVMVAGTWADLA
ncbi:amidohydrolase family protein [Embleya sp. NPDC008237]|uniref:amidohydrolase family protein n=1 Tax=Embleya sp. NPDC008237 TaxID=3363978 RepID=UPI0036EBBE11